MLYNILKTDQAVIGMNMLNDSYLLLNYTRNE